MIYDNISKLKEYGIAQSVIDFLCGECTLGRHEFENGIYANVDEYETKPVEKCRLEAHKKYIDIQIILSGEERLDYVDIEGLKISEKYDEIRDLIFFEPPRTLSSAKLVRGKFIMLHPKDAHMPQIAVENKPIKVKKVVVKIPVN